MPLESGLLIYPAQAEPKQNLAILCACLRL